MDGKLISTELLSRDTYSAMTRIVRRGTGAVANSSTQGQTVETTTQNAESPTESVTTEPNQTTEEIIEPAA